MLVILVHEHGMTFHLCYLQFFHKCSLFFTYKSFTSLIIPGYFILFEAIVNGIFFIAFSDNSLLMYRSAMDFCMLIFYPTDLPNSLISSSNFLVVCLGFSL